MDITLVAGARPNFMKIAPIIKAIKSAQSNGRSIHYRIVHTGQHFDKIMSDNFFKQLQIPEPNINLGCGGGTQAEQTAAIMVKFEKELQEHKPSVVLVVGDVTSTMACTITAKKMGIDVVHVEAGIRSGDMSMPEEINRIVTDSLCDYFFTTSMQASENLLKNGVESNKIYFVGNTMIDTLLQHYDNATKPNFWDEFELMKNGYFLITLHRPSNVDDPHKLSIILAAIEVSCKGYPIVFPVHPRTRKVMEQYQIDKDRIIMIEPQGYHEFLFLIMNSKGLITDSGGITEEATVLDIPCITLRNTTERPETVEVGTNELAGDDIPKMQNYMNTIIEGKWKKGSVPMHWDGQTSERIVDILYGIYEKKQVMVGSM